MKKLLLFSTLILAVITTNAQPNQLLQPSKRTIITGKFNDIPKSRQIVELGGRNMLGEFDIIEFVSQTDGTFKFSLDLNLAQEIYFKYQGQITLILAPGDSLNVEFAKGFDIAKDEELSKYISFSGNRAQLNKDLLDYDCREKDSTYRVDCENESPEQFLETVAKHQQIAETALAAYIEKYKPSQEFIDFQTAAKKYRYSNDLLYYRYCLFTKNLQREGNIYDKKLFPVNNDKALITTDYNVHIYNYLTGSYTSCSKVNQLREAKEFYKLYKYVLDSLNSTEEQGLSKELMLFKVMNFCLEEDKDAFIKLSADYKKLSKNPILNAKIDSLVAIAKRPVTNQNVYAGLDGVLQDSVDVFSEIGKQFKGKLVYVDIWATWCQPCRAEMPASLKMRDYFAGKDVAFVYICIESTKANWEKTIKDMKIEGNHYLISKEQSKEFKKRYAIKGVPTFMLIGKDGTILKGETTSPSQDITYKTIKELLIRGV